MMNRAVLVGRLTKDPELRYTPAGVAVATFTLAVNRTFTNQQGEREADFINCVVWRKPAENVANFLKKGSLTGVDGRVQTRNYEGNDGKRVYVTEIVAESVQFLEPKHNGAEGFISNNNQGAANYSNDSQTSSYRADSSQNNNVQPENSKPINISDDDLPF
ncbi:TPA: single-stranded DNA-binding protein [Listeria monocytogenes]|uniref:single-stranded DNA-binding protein n=1 Tax=Listeria monocytogenes TaxID=1639 RepID=UPI000E6CB321|nr:single-stranded DNA-binding protein [Listeria monocytogenes]EAG1886160.1 single-stranded DNA-binding protein [Listeria monocytogenes]EAG8694440.1 single-stranded DNA-binding protein [Listeria monocytogenes]EEA8531623.1 single-stranded DNA-binding protein [Listeria monocytogenes]EHV5872681.1 single-stranded DNA-binding protein [Listeria monocytogenes]EIW6099481.1 single-stranded DNA-binding protein [Listeria monocytogenes]